jgi:serine/threonine-protein kinase RsbW
VRELRSAVCDFASQSRVPDPPLSDIRLAVSEAVSNAVIHAYHGEEAADVAVSAWLEGDDLRLVIADTGVGIGPRRDSPGLGLGLPLMSSLADSVDVRPANPGTEVHLCFKVAL